MTISTPTPTQFSATVSEHDRCDRCNAKAKMLTITNSGPLTFCNHHAAKFQATLKDLNYFITTVQKAGE